MALKSFSRQNLRNKSAVAAVVGSASLPVISTIVVCDSNYNDLDDTALNPAGGYAKIVGNNFEAGSIVYFNGTSLTTTFISSRELRIQTPTITTGSYNLMLFNLSNGQGAIYLNLSVSNFPTITTSANTVLDEEYETKAISAAIAATGDTPITFSIVPGEGNLPEGVTLSADGTLSGIAPVVGSTTTYTFVVQAKDAQKQDSTRQFSLTVKADVVDWAAPAAGATFSAYEYTPFANIGLSATSRAGYGVSFSSNNLPSGITVVGNTIIGTSNTVGSTNVSVVATSSNTNKSATRNINVIVNPDTVTWSSPANNAVISAYEYTAFSPTSLSATSAAGFDVAYNADSLPAGLSVVNNFVVGTSNTTGTTNTTFTATANTTNRNSTRTVQFAVNPDVVTWSSPTPGSIFTAYEYTAFANVSLSATSAAGFNVSYAVNTLPTGLSLTGTTIAGTSNVVGNTAVSITATANTTGRTSTSNVQFNVVPDVVSWNSPAEGATISVPPNQPIESVLLAANSAAGFGVTYTANGLPTGVTMANGAITGTPTVSGETSNTTLIATASTTGRTATRYIYWSINIGGDAFWKNVGLMVGGTDTTAPAPFINDASLNNTQLSVVADAKPDKFTPYWGNGYYGVSHSATPDYLSVPHNSNFSLTSGQTDTFIIEGWFYFNAVTAQTTLFDKSGVNTVSFSNWGVYLNASKQIQLQWGVSGTPGTSVVGLLASSFVPVPGVWYHIAFVKSSSDWAVFANGTRIITYNGLNTAGDANPSALRIGYGIQGAGAGAYFNGYISNVRAWRGTTGAPYSATSTTLTVPTGPLTAIAGTTLLSHQSATFIDASSTAATITVTGANIKVSSACPFTQTSNLGSAYFDGSTAYITAPNSAALNMGSSNFTIEMWVYPTALAGTKGLISKRASGYAPILLQFEGTVLKCFLSTSGAGWEFAISSPTASPPANRWSHVAIVRNGSTVTMYLNGAAVGSSTANANSLATNADAMSIGATTAGGSEKFQGYISDLRVVKGAVIVPSTTLPSSPLTAVTGTELLTCQYRGGATNNGFVDRSVFSNPIIRGGNPTQGTFSPYSQAGWSNYYPALAHSTYAANPISSFGTGATFTVEGWVNMAVYPATNYHFSLLASCDQGTATYWAIGIGSTGLATVYWYDGNPKQCTGSTVLNRGQWYHVAVVVTAGVIKIYVDGVVQTLSGTTTLTNPTGNATYTTGTERGASNGGSAGHISNLRMSTSVVYTAAFTPSTTPLTALINGSVNSTLLTAQSNRFVDNSTSARAITLGTTKPTVQAYSPFTADAYVPSVNGGSVYFDGSGDFLSTAAIPGTAFGTGDYTVEFWAYPTVNARQDWIDLNNTTASNRLLLYYDGTNIIYYSGSARITGVPMVLNSWQHIALCRYAGSTKLFLNGTQIGNTFTSDTITFPAQPLYIGKDGAGSTFVTGYMSDIRIVSSALYKANFVPPTTALNANGILNGTAYVSSMLLNGTGGGIIDHHGTTDIETVGDAKLSPEDPYAGSYYSNYFDGTGDYLDAGTPMSLSGNFTIEMWFKPDAVSKTYADLFTSASANFELGLNTNSLKFYDSGSAVITHQTSVTAGEWHHVALTRSGTTIYLYLDGVRSTTSATTSTTYVPYRIATYSSETFPGFISNLRVVSGTALYSGETITVPTAPLTAVPGTSLLTCQSNSFKDNSTNNISITRNGDAKATTANPFRQNSGKSLYFDGTGDYLNIPAGSPSLTFGRFDFTIEFWIYTTSTGAQSLFDNRNPDTGNAGFDISILATSNYLRFSTSGVAYIDGTHAVKIGQWNHVALTRSGNVFKLYLNGAQTGLTYNGSTTQNFTNSNTRIGSGAVGPMTGHIKDLRVTRGVVRNIAVPTAPLELK